MFRLTPLRFTAVAAVLAFVVGGFGPLTTSRPHAELQTSREQMSTPEAITFFADRVESDPGDALSATILSELHLRRGRETGDVAEYRLAVLSAEQALARLPKHAPAHLALARATFALHRFAEAAASAEVAAALDPILGAEIVIADAAVARGDVETAAKIYQGLGASFDTPSLDARIAHLAELAGDYEAAIAMMTEATSRALDLGYTGEPAAWFQLRLGDLDFDTGRYADAEASYRRALEIFEPYPAAEAGVARSLAARGRFDEAAQAYERAIALQPMPAVLHSAARLYEHLGMIEDAHRHRSTLDLIAELSDETTDLAHVYHLIDVGRPADALRIAERLAVGRSDASMLDALAWAEYHTGALAAARESISRALDTGTARAQILFHAGVIYSRTDATRSIGLLGRALAISPEFDPIDAAAALALLEELQ